jgi:hypothetical protein
MAIARQLNFRSGILVARTAEASVLQTLIFNHQQLFITYGRAEYRRFTKDSTRSVERL